MPPEIRNQIFGYVLGGKTHEIENPELRRDSWRAPWSVRKPNQAHALLAVCRQIYAETALLAFELNAFSTPSISMLNEWSRGLPRICTEGITSIRLNVNIVRSPGLIWDTGCLGDTMEARCSSVAGFPSLRSIHAALNHVNDGGAFIGLNLDVRERDIKDKLESNNKGIEVTCTRYVWKGPARNRYVFSGY
jgi:hypothetical protein